MVTLHYHAFEYTAGVRDARCCGPRSALPEGLPGGARQCIKRLAVPIV